MNRLFVHPYSEKHHSKQPKDIKKCPKDEYMNKMCYALFVYMQCIIILLQRYMLNELRYATWYKTGAKVFMHAGYHLNEAPRVVKKHRDGK